MARMTLYSSRVCFMSSLHFNTFTTCFLCILVWRNADHLQTIDSFVGPGFMVYLRALLLAMSYTVTQGQRGMTASFYFINIPAQLTPYAMIAVNLLFPGGVASMILQLEGLVAAHLFEFLTVIWPQYGGTGNSLLPTPPVLVKLVDAISGVTERVGAATQGRAADSSAGRSTGSDSGPLPDSWRTRGRGQRLG